MVGSGVRPKSPIFSTGGAKVREINRLKIFQAAAVTGLAWLSVIPAARADQGKETAFKWIDENRQEIIRLADQIWELAEPAFQEFRSSEILQEALSRNGFRITQGVESMKTDFVAEYGSGKPVIALLAEYDALPGLSQDRLPNRHPAEEGAGGHGCGHNLLGAGAVGGALALKAAMERHHLPGTVRLFGTPAEEGGNGKVYMVRSGLFDDVDVVLHWHPGDRNQVQFGSTLAVKSYRFQFHGLSAHAALNPDRGRSALDAVELMNAGVNALREHVPEDTRIHYVITEGGRRPNVVPDFAEVWYYIRSPRIGDLEAISGRVEEVARGASLMTATTVDIRIAGGSWNILPNRTLSEILLNNLKTVGAPVFGDEEIAFAHKLRDNLEKEGMDFTTELLLDAEIHPLPPEGKIHRASTDVGDVSWVVPTGGFNFAARLQQAPTHSWPFVATAGTGIGHEAALQAARLFAATAIDLLDSPETIALAHEEFIRRRGDTRYRSIIPEGQPPPDKID